LVRALVTALHAYGAQEDMRTAPVPASLDHTQRGLWDAATFLLGVGELLRRGLLSKTARARLHDTRDVTRLLGALQEIAQLRDAFTDEDEATLRQLLWTSDQRRTLERAMQHAFEIYGPEVKRGTFSRLALYHALAAILIHVGIEQHAPTTIVSRLRKATQRGPRLR
jgi:hypothetical protein